jgi:hypothetical protein
LGSPLHNNYTFSSPDGSFTCFSRVLQKLMASYGSSSVSSHGYAPLHATPFVSPSYGAPLHIHLADVSSYACPLTNRGHQRGSPFGAEALRRLLQPLEGLRTPAPTSAPQYLYTIHVTRTRSVLAFSKTTKPLRSLTFRRCSWVSMVHTSEGHVPIKISGI